MIRISLLSLFFFYSIYSAPLHSTSKSLVLISFDGFRYDTLNSTIAPNITEWASGGVLFKNGVQPQAVTFTAPNHYSIITGLYEDAHGIMGNIFFDQQRRQFYDIYNLSYIPGIRQASLDPSWYTSETIWQSNARAGGQSAVVHWPIGDVASGDDEHTTFVDWKDHGSVSDWINEVETVIDAIQKGKNLVAWYISEPDHTLHGNGFYHQGLYRKIMADLDVTFGYFLKRLKELNLFETTDIIFTADHGHAEIKSLDMVLCMDKFISGQIGVDYQVSDHTILAYTEEQAIEIYQILNDVVAERKLPVKVIWTKDVPSSWHFSHPSRLGQVMVIPEVGADARFSCYWKDATSFHSSTHGHAPENAEMRAVLAVRGPSFKEGEVITSIPQNIDIFPLMGRVLGIPLPAHNASIERIEGALREKRTAESPEQAEKPTEDEKTMQGAAVKGVEESGEESTIDPSTAYFISIALIVLPLIVIGIIVYYCIMRIKNGPNKQFAQVSADATEPML